LSLRNVDQAGFSESKIDLVTSRVVFIEDPKWACLCQPLALQAHLNEFRQGRFKFFLGFIAIQKLTQTDQQLKAANAVV